MINRAGWDGVDAVRANMYGWNTYELKSIKVLHLKPTGSADGKGMIRASLKYGDVGYYMGGYFWYFLLRVLGRSIEKRKIVIGVYMIKGYLKSLFKRIPREDKEFRAFLKRQQWDNFKFWIKKGTHRLRFSKQ